MALEADLWRKGQKLHLSHCHRELWEILELRHTSGGVNVKVCRISFLNIYDMLWWGLMFLSWKDMVITGTRNLNST